MAKLIVLGLLIVAMIIGAVFAFGTIQFKSGSLAKFDGSGGMGNGCVLSDTGFKDTSLATNPEQTYNTLAAKYPAASQQKDKILQILSTGKDKGINPVVPLAIWNGEQGFKNPDDAFGYGNLDSGTLSGTQKWDYQLSHVYGAISDAINNTKNYTDNDPAIKDTNIFTRLFWHYTTAMKVVYTNSGNKWDENAEYTDGSKPVKNRMGVVELLDPSQIVCATRTQTSGSQVTGSVSSGAITTKGK